VPTLRFPEFREAGEWVEKKLGELVDIKSGISPSKCDLSTKGKYAFLKVEDLNNCDKYQIESREYSDEKNNLIPNKSVIFPKRGAAIHLNKVRINIEQVLMDTNLMAITPNGKIYTEFLFYKIVNEGLSKIADTSTIPQINNKHIEPFSVLIPSKSEQQKIAACLSSLDELITAHSKKLDALKKHKKGLMQQLFPAEGQTVPSLCFPEFREAGEWVEKKLGEFIEEFREKSSIQDEFEVLTSSRSGLVKQREYYDNDRITERDNVGFNIIPPNYLTYRSRSDVRRFYFNENNLNITGIVSVYYPVFRMRIGDNKFFVKLFSHYSDIIGKYSVGTSQTVLSLNELKRINMPIPSLPEQQKIAACLSSLDELITAHSKKLDALKKHKKGLMQQLFPAVEED